MDEIWVAGLLSLVGVALGSFVTALTTRWSGKWQKEDRAEQEAQALRQEVRQRAVGRAEGILVDLRSLESLLSRRIILYRADVVASEDQMALRELLARIEISRVYLTSPTREAVSAVTAIIPSAPQLAEERWVPDSAQVVARLVIRYARLAVECFIRGEEPPPEDPQVELYLEAHRDLCNSVEEAIERQMAEAEQGLGPNQ